MVLDCCSSAGATRDPGHRTGTTRFFPIDDVQPVPVGHEVRDTARGVAEGLVGTVANCQVVAACQANEKAQEDGLDGRVMGHLTRSIWEQPVAINPGDLPALRWGQIWRQVQDAVLERNPYQRPWLSTGYGRAVFGGDPDDRGDVGFAVAQHGDRYRLDVGALAGMAGGRPDRRVRRRPGSYSPP